MFPKNCNNYNLYNTLMERKQNREGLLLKQTKRFLQFLYYIYINRNDEL